MNTLRNGKKEKERHILGNVIPSGYNGLLDGFRSLHNVTVLRTRKMPLKPYRAFAHIFIITHNLLFVFKISNPQTYLYLFGLLCF